MKVSSILGSLIQNNIAKVLSILFTEMDPRLGKPCTASYILAVLWNTRSLPLYIFACAAHSSSNGAIAHARYP
jgi:hypothetical protein